LSMIFTCIINPNNNTGFKKWGIKTEYAEKPSMGTEGTKVSS